MSRNSHCDDDALIAISSESCWQTVLHMQSYGLLVRLGHGLRVAGQCTAVIESTTQAYSLEYGPVPTSKVNVFALANAVSMT